MSAAKSTIAEKIQPEIRKVLRGASKQQHPDGLNLATIQDRIAIRAGEGAVRAALMALVASGHVARKVVPTAYVEGGQRYQVAFYRTARPKPAPAAVAETGAKAGKSAG